MLWHKLALLSLVYFILACTPPPATPATPTTQLVVPTPPTTAVDSTSLLPVLLPNEANQWITYHDSLSDFGLALPQEWRITPPDPHAAQATLAVANFDPTFVEASCPWPNQLAHVLFTHWSITPEQATLDWIGTNMRNVQSLEAANNGRYAGYLLTTEQQQHLILRLTPTLLMQIQVMPQMAWQLPDVQNILNSLAAPGDPIDLPAIRPTAPVAVPNFCQEAVHLYSGPGTHFEEIGLLFANDSLPVIGHSRDGRWLKLLYSESNNNTAWAPLQDTIATAGKPPIESTRIQPGNS